VEEINEASVQLLELAHTAGAKVPLRRIREAVGVGAWDSIMLDALHKRLQAGIEKVRETHIWRNLVSFIKPVRDFRTQYSIQTGSFTTFDSVEPQGPYYQTWFSDDRANYSVSKYGNIFALSLEEMTNDDLGVFGRTAEMFGKAYAESIEKYVVETLINDNPTIYDSNSLFDSTNHSNYQSSSFSLNRSNLETAKTAMRNQTDLDGNPLNIRPRFLLVNPAQEWTARRLVNSPDDPETANRAVNVHYRSLTVLVSSYVTAGTWYLIGDPNMCSTIELGFLNGNQGVELFEENADSGTSFTRDVKRWKARGIHGGAVLDYRGFYCGVA
jgi:hypothetical protein